MTKCLTLSLCLLLCTHSLGQLAADAPASAPTTAPVRILRFPNAAIGQLGPGFHKLICRWPAPQRDEYMSFSLYLPRGYRPGEKRWPMLVFLGGLGDRGADPALGMTVGVPLEIGRSEEMAAWMPMIVLTPQCPSDSIWTSPGVPERVVRLLQAAMPQFDVDRGRVYLTGFSDGGRGVWAVAAAEPTLFAAIAPIVSREHFAEATAKRFEGTGLACLVISGEQDAKSEPASANMVKALQEKNVDVAYARIPGGSHFIWRAFYSQRFFYEWLLLHERGKAPAATRPGGDAFITLFQSREQVQVSELLTEHRLQRGLDRLEPYWYVDNCSLARREVGLQPFILGRRNVFVTLPLSGDVPCRLQTTRQLPADKLTQLEVDLGHTAEGEWELLVRVNEQEQLVKLINDETAPGGWTQIKVDLSPWAGQEARLQLVQRQTGEKSAWAYWSRIKLVEKPR
jgi:hypothetical protein